MDAAADQATLPDLAAAGPEPSTSPLPGAVFLHMGLRSARRPIQRCDSTCKGLMIWGYNAGACCASSSRCKGLWRFLYVTRG